jgi:FtsH-binding integral membrane protein
MNIILLLTAIAIIALYKIYLNSDKSLSANIILENVYLHILLGLILTGLTALSIDACSSISENMNSYRSILGSFILSMIALFMVFSAGDSKGMQYGGYILFMLSIGVMLHPYVSLLKYNGKGASIFLSLITIVGILALIAYKLPNMFIGWGSYLSMALLSLIVVESFDLIFGSTSGLYERSKIYGLIGVILFSGFLLYDSQRLVREAKVGAMLSKYYKTNDVNYPALSLSIYLDIVNLFSSLTNMNNN